MQWNEMDCYVMLCYVILSYVMLCYVVLYCATYVCMYAHEDSKLQFARAIPYQYGLAMQPGDHGFWSVTWNEFRLGKDVKFMTHRFFLYFFPMKIVRKHRIGLMVRVWDSICLLSSILKPTDINLDDTPVVRFRTRRWDNLSKVMLGVDPIRVSAKKSIPLEGERNSLIHGLTGNIWMGVSEHRVYISDACFYRDNMGQWYLTCGWIFRGQWCLTSGWNGAGRFQTHLFLGEADERVSEKNEWPGNKQGHTSMVHLHISIVNIDESTVLDRQHFCLESGVVFSPDISGLLHYVVDSRGAGDWWDELGFSRCR